MRAPPARIELDQVDLACLFISIKIKSVSLKQSMNSEERLLATYIIILSLRCLSLHTTTHSQFIHMAAQRDRLVQRLTRSARLGQGACWFTTHS